jgi:hypothetical protein
MQHLGQILVAHPAASPQSPFAFGGQRRRAIDVQTDRGQQTVADQLQRVHRPRSTRHNLDDVRAITTGERTP